MHSALQAIIDQVTNKICEPAAGRGALLLLVAATKHIRNQVLSNPPHMVPGDAPADGLPKGGSLHEA